MEQLSQLFHLVLLFLDGLIHGHFVQIGTIVHSLHPRQVLWLLCHRGTAIEGLVLFSRGRAWRGVHSLNLVDVQVLVGLSVLHDLSCLNMEIVFCHYLGCLL